MGVVKLSTAGILNFQKYSSMRAGIPLPFLTDFDLLETQVLASSAASVTFSSLSTYAADYQHLQIRMTSRSARNTGSNDAFLVRLNADTGSSYAWHTLYGTGSSVASTAGTSQTSGRLGATLQQNSTADAFGAAVIDLLDVFESTKNTTIKSLAGFTAPTGGHEIALSSVLWNNTNALTTIQVYAASADLLTGTRVSLYGLKAGA